MIYVNIITILLCFENCVPTRLFYIFFLTMKVANTNETVWDSFHLFSRWRITRYDTFPYLPPNNWIKNYETFFFCWHVSCTEDICYVGWARGRLGIRFANDRIILEIHGERISHDWHNGERDLGFRGGNVSELTACLACCRRSKIRNSRTPQKLTVKQ